ncbi:hypothetical protein DSO57_1012103 [Entomophthora muscae]|uniref:Uncharacterized protein n=1 Tax=Entomophthora muscae TaxID=34485 RepID=A0ACC2SJH5_9FUNG|nr:hypothetical protein DSO57_1012103 [Entomophthora muscae]
MPIPTSKRSPQVIVPGKLGALLAQTQPNLAIKHPKVVEAKLKSILADGKDKLQIITGMHRQYVLM